MASSNNCLTQEYVEIPCACHDTHRGRKINHKKKSTNKKGPKIQLLASGPMLNEAIKASQLLEKDWNINTTIWSVTSYSELHKEAEDVRRWNILHPESEPRKSFIAVSYTHLTLPTKRIV